jgi:capsular polysaccharide transport system permease protein
VEAVQDIRAIARRFAGHGRIIWALLLRELATRYGRSNLGFLWTVAEPLLFCAGVVALWSVVKPPYEHGVKIVPFVVTGYMPIIMVRHMINQAMGCVRSNGGLLYHRQISLLHLFAARLTLEFLGVTAAFVIVVLVLMLLGQSPPPQNLLLLYGGWCLLSWLSASLAMVLGAIAELAEAVERVVGLFTYILVPLSGTFYMVAWLPAPYQKAVLYLPFIHPVEMIRGGFFGPGTLTIFDPLYAAAWAGGLTVLGLLLLRLVRARVEVD